MEPLCGKALLIALNNSTSVLQFLRTQLKPCTTQRIRCSLTDGEPNIDDFIIAERHYSPKQRHFSFAVPENTTIQLKPCITQRIRCSFTDGKPKIDDFIIEITLQARMIRSSGFIRILLCFALRKPQEYSARCKAGVFLLEQNTWAKAGPRSKQKAKGKGEKRRALLSLAMQGRIEFNAKQEKKD